jgi:O-6-methylguanine DNA methyltransferase
VIFIMIDKRHDFKNRHIHTCVIRHGITTVVVRGIEKAAQPLIMEILVGSRAKEIAPTVKPSSQSTLLAEAVGLLKSYLDGSRVDFATIRLDEEGISPFQGAVLLAARRIPFGSTVSYSSLAAAAGHPRAVRAAASVMARNRFPLVIPCHRVIHKDGSLGAYAGDRHGDDAAVKRRLLQLEKEVLKGKRP